MAPVTIRGTFMGLHREQTDLKPKKITLKTKAVVARDERRYDTNDMKGVATSQYIITNHGRTKDNSFAGHQIFEGTILGKTGTLVCQTEGTYTDETKIIDADWTIIPEACTGELEGVTGSGNYVMDHSDLCGGAAVVAFELTLEML